MRANAVVSLKTISLWEDGHAWCRMQNGPTGPRGAHCWSATQVPIEVLHIIYAKLDTSARWTLRQPMMSSLL